MADNSASSSASGLQWEIDGAPSYGVFKFQKKLTSQPQTNPEYGTTSEIITLTVLNKTGLTYYGVRIYIKPTEIPELKRTAKKMYDELLWYGTVYPGQIDPLTGLILPSFPSFGMSVQQSYFVKSIVTDMVDKTTLADHYRKEYFDVFKGKHITITSGPYKGSKNLIKSYDIDKKEFYLESAFTFNPALETYEIDASSTIFFKQGVGSSPHTGIYLANNGGILKPGEAVDLKVQISMPNYIKRAGYNTVDFALVHEYER